MDEQNNENKQANNGSEEQMNQEQPHSQGTNLPQGEVVQDVGGETGNNHLAEKGYEESTSLPNVGENTNVAQLEEQQKAEESTPQQNQNQSPAVAENQQENQPNQENTMEVPELPDKPATDAGSAENSEKTQQQEGSTPPQPIAQGENQSQPMEEPKAPSEQQENQNEQQANNS